MAVASRRSTTPGEVDQLGGVNLPSGRPPRSNTGRLHVPPTEAAIQPEWEGSPRNSRVAPARYQSSADSHQLVEGVHVAEGLHGPPPPRASGAEYGPFPPGAHPCMCPPRDPHTTSVHVNATAIGGYVSTLANFWEKSWTQV